jgi:hypothetical protein
MNKFRMFLLASFLLLCVFFISGCATTYQYQGNNFPPLSSPSLPSFKTVNEITDGIKFRFAEGSWKTKTTADTTMSINQQNTPRGSVSTVSQWDIDVKDNLVYSSNLEERVFTVHDQKLTENTKMDSIHEINGKEIKMNVSRIEKLDFFKRTMSDYINYQFASLGKTLKTGDVLKLPPGLVGTVKGEPDQNSQNITPQVIKGVGVYKNKKVIVTEYSLDDSFHDSESIGESRVKGYSLFDAETFIPLFGEGVFYLNVFNPKVGTIYMKMDVGFEAYDVQIRNILDSPTLANSGVDKESAKPSWSEASEKIEALGELFKKRLISKEEYETKKSELLKGF